MCEQLAQGRYMMLEQPGVETELPLDRKSDGLTTAPLNSLCTK